MRAIDRRRHHIEDVETYELFAAELEMIERGYSSRQNDLTLFGISIGIFGSFLLALVPYAISDPPRAYAALWYWIHVIHVAVLGCGGIFSTYFFWRWRATVRRETPIFQKIRDRQLEPAGQEGKEIKAAEAAVLPSQESSEAEK